LTYLLPSLIKAIAIDIRLRKTITNSKIPQNTKDVPIKIINHVSASMKYELINDFKFGWRLNRSTGFFV